MFPVGHTAGPRKAKRVSDVAAMGAPSPAPGFSPVAAPYNPGFAPTGSPPPPYHEGIQLETQDFGPPAPAASKYPLNRQTKT